MPGTTWASRSARSGDRLHSKVSADEVGHNLIVTTPMHAGGDVVAGDTKPLEVDAPRLGVHRIGIDDDPVQVED